MRLLIVRHGESTANRDHLVLGQSLPAPLTELGRLQAEAAAATVAGLVAAFLFRRLDPELPKKKYSWEIEEQEAAARGDDELELPAPREVPLLWVRPEHPEEEPRGVVLRFTRHPAVESPPREPPTS